MFGRRTVVVIIVIAALWLLFGLFRDFFVGIGRLLKLLQVLLSNFLRLLGRLLL